MFQAPSGTCKLSVGTDHVPGTKWHSHRKMITPTFHFKILENFQEVFVEKSEIMLKKLRPNAHGRVFDIYPFITRCALDIICETAMGTQLNAQEDMDSEYVNAVYDISEATINRALSPWLHPDFIFQRTKMGRRYQECIQQLHRFTNKVIQEKKSLLAGATRVTDQSSDEDTSIGKKKRRAFLDLLLEASLQEGGLSDEEIREEVDTFMFEGHDTTAAGISWTIFLLGIHPEIQVRVQRELDEIFQGVSRAATMQDVQEMKYLEQVIKESLRLYPSVPFIQRHLNQDIKLDQFNPDNFRLENVQARHPYAYIPFSAGPRNCIGQKFALQEEKTILSYLFRHYSVRCLDKMEDVVTLAELVLRPENGIRVVLTPRDKASLHTL
ncbi:unnamed protein product [Timema podura]|uniref:Cytochrome P450 n=1 Tax=Timema podura TaxID=61482 RepID=A0ABN7P3N4_TIMPD|nr:unnamed protein product [Timema podura]